MAGTLGKASRDAPKSRQADPLKKYQPWGGWDGTTDWLDYPRTAIEEAAFA